ncbi:MAG: hypothetical protein ABWX88_05105 [Pseudoxanthomonas sp.]
MVLNFTIRKTGSSWQIWFESRPTQSPFPTATAALKVAKLVAANLARSQGHTVVVHSPFPDVLPREFTYSPPEHGQ